MRCLDCGENVRQELSHFIKMGFVPIVCKNCGAELELSKIVRIFAVIEFSFGQLLSSKAWSNGAFDNAAKDTISLLFYFCTVILLLLVFVRPLDYFRKEYRFISFILDVSFLYLLFFRIIP